MEFVAWFTHKFVMHGFLWILHEDHHRPHKGRFEKNDLFAFYFAGIAILFFALGAFHGLIIYTSIAIGVTLYGIGYFLFHDVMFHRRIKGFRIKASTPYLKRIIHAHSVHHQSTDKNKSTTFGFLYASKKYDIK
ncbi:MAG: beta-carotene hydroxylase [Spirochaetes bacterium]|nr:beta-carotene hydroxylase [Spirochaetota bacterium]